MIRFLKVGAFALIAAASLSQTYAADCSDDPRTTGLSRTVAINPVGGGTYGRLQYKENTPLLRPKEVILTFDDGPHPVNTRTILDVLDRHCVKATFFMVGRMAVYSPKMVKAVADRGHTVATHTWSHVNASKVPVEEAKLEIEKGFVAAAQALGEPVAPFFRYPGLNDSAELNAYLASRDITVWSVDIVSGDTHAGQTPETLVRGTMDRLRKMNRGIVLFHDLKSLTADSLDSFLTQLRMEGYKVVHVVSNSAYRPNPGLVARLDIDKRALEKFAFTGITEGDELPNHSSLMQTGEVDVMRTEFVHIDTSSSASKGEVAKRQQPQEVAKRSPLQGVAKKPTSNAIRTQ